MSAPSLWLVSGDIGAGKTTLCRALADLAHAAGWDVAGLLSPGVFEAGGKTGILAQDLRSGEARLLASATPKAGFDLVLGAWHFDPAVLAWGNGILEASQPCDLLIVDELGPLELLRSQGWTAGLEALRRGGYRLGVATIRPSLQGLMGSLLPVQRIIVPDPADSGQAAAAHYREALNLLACQGGGAARAGGYQV